MVYVLGGGALFNWGPRAAVPLARLQGRAWLWYTQIIMDHGSE